jgi:ABC-2 type transport system ATP-binding protein
MGMRKKLAIAAALLGTPKIIFLDEALNGIDIESAFQIKQVLKDFVVNGGTIILSSHALEVIEKICDRYLVLRNGEIIADLTADGFKKSGVVKDNVDLEGYIIQLLNA